MLPKDPKFAAQIIRNKGVDFIVAGVVGVEASEGATDAAIETVHELANSLLSALVSNEEAASIVAELAKCVSDYLDSTNTRSSSGSSASAALITTLSKIRVVVGVSSVSEAMRKAQLSASLIECYSKIVDSPVDSKDVGSFPDYDDIVGAFGGAAEGIADAGQLWRDELVAYDYLSKATAFAKRLGTLQAFLGVAGIIRFISTYSKHDCAAVIEAGGIEACAGAMRTCGAADAMHPVVFSRVASALLTFATSSNEAAIAVAN